MSRRPIQNGQAVEMERPLFFKVKFGDDKEAFFNSNCTNELLSRAIKQKCSVGQAETLDLVSLSGEPLYFFKRPGTEYAHRTFHNREAYIAATVEAVPHSSTRRKYTPLLKDMDSYPDVVERLAEEENPEKAANNTKRGRGRYPRAAQGRMASNTDANSEHQSNGQLSPSQGNSPSPTGRRRSSGRGWEVGRKLLASKRLRAMSGGSISNKSSTVS